MKHKLVIAFLAVAAFAVGCKRAPVGERQDRALKQKENPMSATRLFNTGKAG